MSFMDKNPSVGDISSCNSLPETPYDSGRGQTCHQTQPEISKMGNGWGGPRANSGGVREGAGRKPKQRIIQRLPEGPRWYVVQTMGGQERRVVRDLLEGEDRPGYIQRKPFEAYAPEVAVQRVYRRAGQAERRTVHVPMFSGYLFCAFDRDLDRNRWGAITHIDGVLQLFTTRSLIPIPLPPGLVESLMDTAADRLNLPKLRLPEYAPGQALRVESGPFASHPAVCVACDGLMTKVSIHLFGRDVEFTLPRSELSVAEPDRRPLDDRAQ